MNACLGEKLREVLRTQDIGIRLYDRATGLVSFVYQYEHGQRLQVEPVPIAVTSLTRYVIGTGRPLVIPRDR